MTDCLGNHASPFMQVLAEVHDRLGWDNFIESMICTMYFKVAKFFIPSTLGLAAESWGCQFFHKLMVAMHKQWLFYNSHLHYKKLDALTVQQREDIFARVKELQFIDPADLLPCHQCLLEGDFSDLGEGVSVNRQHWVASMDAAVASSSYIC